MKKVMVVLASVMFMGSMASAEYLLSANHIDVVGGDIFAVDTPTIDTGATYSWEYGNLGNVIGNTDAQVISTDEEWEGYMALQNGASSSIGGNGSVYSTWGGGTGTGDGDGPFAANVATCVFDLKDVYTITEAMISMTTKVYTSNYTTIGYLEIMTSTDGENYTTWATYDGTTPAGDNANEILTFEEGNVDAQYMKFYFDRVGTLDDGGYVISMIINEIGIYGNVVPEPATVSLIMLGGGLAMLKKRRNK